MLRKILNRWISFGLFLFWACSGKAQESGLNFLNIGSRHGLSSNNVTSILKDSYGYLWFGTNDGLNKYDGINFTVYRHRENEPNSILSNEIRDLYEDAKGNIWIGTGGGLTLFNRELNTFIRYNKTYTETVIAINSSPSNGLWLGTYDGLLSFDPSSGKIRPVRLNSSSSRQAIAANVVDIFKDKKGRSWLATNQGLYSYSPQEGRFLHFSSSTDQSSLVDNRVRSIAEDPKGNIWIGTENGLSLMVSARPGKFINYKAKPGDRKTISSNIIYSMTSGKDGNIWIGTEKGITVMDPATRQFERVVSDQAMFSLNGKAIKTIYADYDNMLWAGTDRSGVFKHDKSLTFFNLKQVKPLHSDWAERATVTAFEEFDKGQIFIGTDGSGLSFFNLRTGHFHFGLSSSLDRLRGKSILTMEKVGTQLWIGTFLDGIFIFDTQTQTLRQILKANENKSISGNDIFCLKLDKTGKVWIGTNGQGVNWFDTQTKRFHNFKGREREVPRQLSRGFIRSIAEDPEGNLWIAARGEGIVVYNPKTSQYRILNKANSRLPKDQVNSIHITTEGTVWAGMTEGGLALYNKNTKLFSKFSEEDGLANEVIYTILEDKNGNLWLSTNKGVSCFNPRSRKFQNFTQYNGLQQGAFVSGAGMSAEDGTLLFGGTEGFNYLNPKDLVKSVVVPRLIFTDLKVAGKSVLPGKKSEIASHISVAREVEISYKQNFSISFTALNFGSPQDSRYLYKLDKFDKGWIDGGNMGNAVYTNLDPGEYTFHAKAISASGEWQSKPVSLSIYVRPPFWLTTPAFIFYFVTVAAALWYLRLRAVKKLKYQLALEQERKEAQRLREFDRLKIKFLTNLSHEFRTPISLITGPVEQLAQGETNTEKAGQLGLVQRNAKRLLNLVNQLLDFRDLEEKESKLNYQEKDFIAFSKDIAESFRDLAGRKQISFDFHTSVEHYVTRFDPDKLERVLFNVLSNAFKFTLRSGEVGFHISINADQEGLVVRITDSGVGISETEKDKIFTRFYQVEGNTSVINQGSGIGLSIAKELLILHGGDIDVESSLGQGSTFSIRLPFKEIISELTAEELNQDVADVKVHHQLSAEHPAASVQQPVILIVEDDEDFRYYLEESLKPFYRIIVAADGKEGWQKTLSLHPQLVVSDVNMPLMSGVELSKKIKSDKRTSHIPIILLTAISGEEEHLRGLETGASDYITKPFSFNILNIKIRNMLSLNEQFKNTYSKHFQVIPSDLSITSENEKLLNKVVEYIESNLSNSELSVQDLSKHVGMSRGSLYSKILEISGETPVEFIRSIKLKRAASLLANSDMNIAQVAYAVGFSSPSYFAQTFKAYYNMPPSEYLQSKRNQ